MSFVFLSLHFGKTLYWKCQLPHPPFHLRTARLAKEQRQTSNSIWRRQIKWTERSSKLHVMSNRRCAHDCMIQVSRNPALKFSKELGALRFSKDPLGLLRQGSSSQELRSFPHSWSSPESFSFAKQWRMMTLLTVQATIRSSALLFFIALEFFKNQLCPDVIFFQLTPDCMSGSLWPWNSCHVLVADLRIPSTKRRQRRFHVDRQTAMPAYLFLFSLPSLACH